MRILTAAPHRVGAPRLHELGSEVPPEISGHVTATAPVIEAVLPALPRAMAGWSCQRTAGPVAAA
jgi:predicted cobalt transporter CbtA